MWRVGWIGKDGMRWWSDSLTEIQADYCAAWCRMQGRKDIKKELYGQNNSNVPQSTDAKCGDSGTATCTIESGEPLGE